MRRFIGGLVILIAVQFSEVQAQEKAIQSKIKADQKLIFEEDFAKPIDTALWRVELENSPGSSVNAENNKLVLNTGAGVTVWLKRKLLGNVLITYDRKVITGGGPFDRLSDLNQFFMASEPQGQGLAVRNGQLDEYNAMKLYYVGMGGNSNTTTRFRKYDGSGNRNLLAEYKDREHLLAANEIYHIEIEVRNGEVSYSVNGKQFFTFSDKEPLTEGYFGFRATKSHQEISNVKIYAIR
jgi:rhamnogalacturonan endolyase